MARDGSAGKAPSRGDATEREREARGRVRRILESSSLDPNVSAGARRPDVAADARFVRAENEDDDGYDPYSDRPGERLQWGRDPWD